jgi:hypothetical protein
MNICAALLALMLPLMTSVVSAHTEEAAFYSDQVPDPSQPWWLAHDWFGAAVSVDGNTAAVGAAHEGGLTVGAVYIYVRDSGGGWIEQAKIPNPEGVFNFGKTVSLHDDTLLVTALDAGDYQGTGFAYVYVRTGTEWSLQASLVGDSNDLDGFGYAGAVHEDTAVVTSWHDDDQGKNAGAAHIFVRSGSTWTREAKLYPSDAVNADHFGRAVDLEGDTLAVNSMLGLNAAGVYAGNAYIFVRQNGSWVEQAKLEASDAEGADNFGVSLNINRNYLAVGALAVDAPGGNDRGAAYIFRRNGCEWEQQARLEPDEANEFMYFGQDVALQGNTAIIGAPNDDDFGVSTGSVYVYTRSSQSWSQHSKIVANDAAANNMFGGSVALTDDKAVIGASLFLQGKVYMYDLDTDNTGWGPQTKVCFNGCHP